MHLQNCPICGTQFKVYKNQKRTYCSRECMSKGYAESLKGENNPNYRHGPKYCVKCGGEIHRNAQKWCNKCRPRTGEDNPFFGEKHTDETCKKLSKKRKGKNYWKGKKHTQSSKNKISKDRKTKWAKMSDQERKPYLDALLRGVQTQLKHVMTKPEKIVQDFLIAKNIEHKHNHHMYDKFFVDFWLPQENIVIEVFGDYWHGNPEVFESLSEKQEYQKKRDNSRVKYLTFCGHSVIVMWENDLKKGLVSDLWDSKQENC